LLRNATSKSFGKGLVKFCERHVRTQTYYAEGRVGYTVV
jgi:hypothetical protein